MERPDEVLSGREVDGRLASDRGVDLAEQRRRHRDPAKTAQVRCGGEACEVGRGSAAVADDRGVPVEPQLVPQPVEDGRGLRGLSPGYGMDC